MPLWILVSLIWLNRADFLIRHIDQNIDSDFRDSHNPGLTKMLTVGGRIPVYTQADIDAFRATGYIFLANMWNIRIPDSTSSTQYVKDDDVLTWACLDIAITDQRSLTVQEDTRYNNRSQNWRLNIFLIVCVSLVDQPKHKTANGEAIPRGEHVWYGFLDYFDPNQDMLQGFDPETRQGPYWEHWPIWSTKPTRTYPNNQGRYLFELDSQALSPATPEYPDGLICQYISRVFTDDRSVDEYQEQDDAVYCPEYPLEVKVDRFSEIL